MNKGFNLFKNLGFGEFKYIFFQIIMADSIKEDGDGFKREEDIGGLDMFSETVENREDKENREDIKAAVISGLLTEDVKREEERMAEETLRFERQEEAKRKQLLIKEEKELNKLERFRRLQTLLNKSKLYSEFLKQKMNTHEDSLKLKKKTVEERNQKRAEKSTELGENGSKGKKIEDEVDEFDSKDVARAKSGSKRKFEGLEIPENQPLLISGRPLLSFHLYLVASLNGIRSDFLM